MSEVGVLSPVGSLTHTPDISPLMTLPLLLIEISSLVEDGSGIKSYVSSAPTEIQDTTERVLLCVGILDVVSILSRYEITLSPCESVSLCIISVHISYRERVG